MDSICSKYLELVLSHSRQYMLGTKNTVFSTIASPTKSVLYIFIYYSLISFY